jgi:prepilin-type N-terminal cleavage/methylation domain-containing protein
MRISAPTTDRDRGFTLVELLIVIVILGVLSSVAVFAVRGISSRGEAAACQADVKTLETAIEVWRVRHPGTDTVSEDDLVQAGNLRSPSTRYDVIDALTIVPTAGGGCVGQATTGSSSTTTASATTTTANAPTTTAGATTTTAGATTTTAGATTTTTSGACPPGQWVAEWYSNRLLSGTPAAQTCEAAINNMWASNAPSVTGIPADQFSVRWTGTLMAAATRQYTFTAYTDDGIRVLVDGVRVIDSWIYQSTTLYAATVNLAAGQHTVIVEYFEANGTATARVSYAPV